jgi:transcriptional regulator with XRE-family HTH domain
MAQKKDRQPASVKRELKARLAAAGLRKLRQDRKQPWTLVELAKRTGYRKSHLSNLERGQGYAGPKLISKLAHVMLSKMPQAEARKVIRAAIQESQEAAR